MILVGTASRRRLLRDQRGFVLVFFAVALPALLGLVGLVIDVGRLMVLDTQLAGIADAAALAAASKLDRSADATRNARDAAGRLANAASFATEGSRVELTYRFAPTLADLRGSPTFTLGDESAASAIFVEVKTADRSVAASFLQMLGATSSRTRRTAVAVSLYYACDVTPALLCQRDPEAFKARASRGRQYLARLGGVPADGTLALIDPPDDVGGRGALISLASNAPNFCYAMLTALRTNLAPARLEEGLNVRFDRYFTSGGARIDPALAAFPPAPSIIQGRRLSSCRSLPAGGDVNPPFHLPRDPGFRVLGPTTPYDAGTGDWKATPAYGGGVASSATALDEYVLWNHGNKSPVFQGELATSRSRYELYLRELGLTFDTEANPVTTSGSLPPATLPTGGPVDSLYRALIENPVPRCYEGAAAPVEARRRVLYLGIADCRAAREAVDPAEMSLSVGKFFLTEPAENGAVLLEFQNLLRPGQDDGKLRHVVHLVDAG